MENSDPDKFHHPSDHFNRKWFGDPEAAAPILRLAVPDSLKSLVKPENLTLEPVSFIDQKLRATQSDLLWSCRSGDSEQDLVYFYVLWEHQSSVDHWMVLRLFIYMARIWENWLDSIKSADDLKGKRTLQKLPIVFPMVIHQGEDVWASPTSLSELTRDFIPDDVRPYFPEFRFHLEELSNRDAEDLPPGLAQLGISVMKLMWDEDFTAWLSQMREQLIKLHEAGLEDKVNVLFVYAFSQVNRSRRGDFLEQIHQHLEPMTATGQSIYDSLIEEGIEKGMEKGMEKERLVLVRNMSKNGMDPAAIAKATGLDKDEVVRLLAE